jgi:hypothetical protein
VQKFGSHPVEDPILAEKLASAFPDMSPASLNQVAKQLKKNALVRAQVGF